MSASFEPYPILRNKHIQTALNSLGPRRLILANTAARIQATESQHLINCGKNIRLLGAFNKNWLHTRTGKVGSSKKLVILLHGWEGSFTSNYIISASAKLLSAGYDVFRLNFRDHGPSLHLNKELFNSTLMPEVARGILKIRVMFPRQSCFLAGYSLGGNFALRIAADVGEKLKLSGTVSISPTINPANTMDILQQPRSPYHYYFFNKWKRSLTTKLHYFPELGYGETLQKCKTLKDINDFFIPNFTAYSTPAEYFSAYTIDSDRLSRLQVPSTIIASKDDPIIPVSDLYDIKEPRALTTEITSSGGHCGFLEKMGTNSWAESRMLEIFSGLS